MRSPNCMLIRATLALLWTASTALAQTDYPIRPASSQGVQLEKEFWGSRLQTNRESWKSAPNPSGFEIEKDRFCSVKLDAITTDALRLQIHLKPGYSSEISEWRVTPEKVVVEPASAKVKKKRPNIVFIYGDDHSEAAISSYGSRINQTPNIDRLASMGMRFTQSFVANSICGPARATLLTGTHSHINGRVNNVSAFKDDLPTWSKQMQAEGYQTAMIGKWHLPTKPSGFDFWAKTSGYYSAGMQSSEGKLDRSGYTVDVITDVGLDWMKNSDPEKPFAIWLSHNAVHRTWMPAADKLNHYRNDTIPEPSTLFDDYAGRSPGAAIAQMRISKDLFPAYDLKLPVTGEGILDGAATRNLKNLSDETREAWKAAYGPGNQAFLDANLSGDELTSWNYQRYIKDYLRCVSSVDDSVGRVMKYLADNDLADNTIVIYSSDQGFFLGEHGWYDKRWMYEPSLRTPLIVHWPGVTDAGSTSDLMVQNIDMAPTFLQMAGMDVPSTMQGESLTPILKGGTPKKWRDAIYYHYQQSDEGRTSHIVAKHYGIRTQRYKLIYVYEHDFWEFYDLRSDPDETHNLYRDPSQADRIFEMKDRLAQMRLDLKDKTGPDLPLLETRR